MQWGNRLCFLLGLAVVPMAWSQAEPRAETETPTVGPVQEMDEVQVRTTEEEDDYDATGMGYLDAERRDPPFSNDLLYEDEPDDELGTDIALELTQVASSSPADLATGSDRLNLRGFPTPRLRNAFAQTGIPEVLEVKRRETIQGPLTSVTGRGAPGGIQNYMTARPPGRPKSQWAVDAGTNEQYRASYEQGGPAGSWGKKVRFFERVALGYERKDGPETYAWRETTTLSAALTVRHNRAQSTLWQVDYADYAGNPSPGIPSYRATASGPVLGPYLPLAGFHGYGPNAGVHRRTGSASVQYEGQPSRSLTVRAALQALQRDLTEDRFSRGDYLLDEHRFAGNREPQRIEQPLTALAADAELTWRLHWGATDHKLAMSADWIDTDYTRRQRGLDNDERAALPLSVRHFDPDAPDYYRPVYTDDTYRRVIADRDEATRYLGFGVSERAAFAEGRFVATAGLRYDHVDLQLTDRTPAALRDAVETGTAEWTYHAGGNVIVSPNHLLAYANVSTAFEPSTRVDARTGQIQGNETTGGFEAGFKGYAWSRRVGFTLHGFSFINRNISRKNPLYRDPIADADQTQPELSAAGRERFQGATFDVRVKPSLAWQLQGKVAYTDAITERSPDLPEEEGRPLARVPAWTGALSAKRSWVEGGLAGWSAGTSLIYVGSYVQTYADSKHVELTYLDYVYVTANLGYRWKTGPRAQSVDLKLTNALNEDLLAKVARTGADPALSVGYRLSY